MNRQKIFSEDFQSSAKDSLFADPLSLLQELIQCGHKSKGSKPLSDARERLIRLFNFLKLLAELRCTKTGMDILSQPLDCNPDLESLEDLIHTIQMWYAILKADLNPQYAFQFIRVQDTSPVNLFFKKIGNLFADSERQFNDWHKKAGSLKGLEEFVRALHGSLKVISSELRIGHPCFNCFRGVLAIENSGAQLLSTVEKLRNALKFHQAALWLVEEGFGELDDALEGMLCLSELMKWLTSLPEFQSKADKPNRYICLGEISEEIIKHWYQNTDVMRAQDLVRTMQQDLTTLPKPSDIIKIHEFIQNATSPLYQEEGLLSYLISNIRVNLLEQPVKEREAEISYDYSFALIDRQIASFLKQTIDQLGLVKSAMQGDSLFTLQQARDFLSPPLVKLEEEKREKQPPQASKKHRGKTLAKEKMLPISKSEKPLLQIPGSQPSSPLADEQPSKSINLDLPGLMADFVLSSSKTLEEVRPVAHSDSKESKQLNALKNTPLSEDVTSPFETLDTSLFEDCIRFVANLEPLSRNSSASCSYQSSSLAEPLTQNKESIVRVMNYCNGHKYSSKNRKADNVVV